VVLGPGFLDIHFQITLTSEHVAGFGLSSVQWTVRVADKKEDGITVKIKVGMTTSSGRPACIYFKQNDAVIEGTVDTLLAVQGNYRFHWIDSEYLAVSSWSTTACSLLNFLA